MTGGMRDQRCDAFGRHHRHVPGVDQVDRVVPVLLWQSGGPLVGLVLAEIDVAYSAILGARDATGGGWVNGCRATGRRGPTRDGKE